MKYELPAQSVCGRRMFLQPNQRRARVRVQSFRRGERSYLLSRAREFIRRIAQHGCAPHEIIDTEGGGITSRTIRRQYMIGAGKIITDRFVRVRAQEDSSGMTHARSDSVFITRDDFKMFGRELVD